MSGASTVSCNAGALLDWRIPDAVSAFTRRDTALYALSVGIGSDPMDTRAHGFIDPWAPQLAALPSMALVLGYPGFWLGSLEVREATGLPSSQILHAEQTITLHDILPVEGEVVGRTRVTGLVARTDGAGSFLHSVREIRARGNERLLASCHQVHYLRGATGVNQSPDSTPPARHAVPSTTPDFVDHVPTRPEQALLYRLNGDANPLHLSPDVALSAGFERPILHGMCTMGLVTHAVVRQLLDYDCQPLRAIRVRMASPVFPGDTIRTEIWRDGSFRAWAVERKIIVLDNGHAILE